MNSKYALLVRDLFCCALIIGLIVALAAHGAVSSGYNWQWSRVWPYFLRVTPTGLQLGTLITEGLACTLRISAQALVLAVFAGLVATVLRLTGGPVSRSTSIAYIQLVRNTPLMVQLLALYAVIPAAWNVSAETVAILALGFFEGAYMAENFRSGILAVPVGQWEAAQSLGLPLHVCWARIILPQALRHCLPPQVSQCVSLLKDSSLAGLIAVGELSQKSGLLVSDTLLSFEVWLPVALIYLALALALAALAEYGAKKLG